ncbi:ADP-ribosylglycohydrolase family protein [Hazenella coriacea]|uniref:ADP-ribosylglycohydrolase n=1 Tax=Hazenella coriacea TaxID=1179467 RepID=A0A4V2UVG9_9BACL|nr:ADP-ribosylglycohydrolase family protein [Hazenella coriacea]TCS95787.1 ADP-ribosylglycohydrolase [Hazenella coriacea]
MNKNKIKGSLLGLAWGDILGSPVEGWKKPEIQSTYGMYSSLPSEYQGNKIPVQRLKRLRPLGLHTDDTQQAMALIHSCLQQGTWSKGAWKQMLVQGLQQQAWRGVGRNFVDAVRRMSRGIPCEQAGSPSSGIGSAMRIGPLGALYSDPKDVDLLFKATLESSLITHADQRAAVFSSVIAYTVSLFIQENPRESVLEPLQYFAKEAEAYVSSLEAEGWKVGNSDSTLISDAIKEAMYWVDEPVRKMRTKISELARPHLQAGFTRAHVNQGFVLLGGLHALLMACRDDMEPQEILLSMINEGYDTDTVAAIAGTILGARFGTDWIPTEHFYDRERILDYTDAIVDKKLPETMGEFIEKEADLTRMEKEFRVG